MESTNIKLINKIVSGSVDGVQSVDDRTSRIVLQTRGICSRGNCLWKTHSCERISWIPGSPIIPVLFLCFSSLVYLSCTPDRQERGADVAGVDISSETVAKVAHFEISVTHFQNKLNQFAERSGQGVNLSPDVQKSILDDRLSRYTMVAYALEQGWDQEPEMMYERRMVERKVWMEAYLRDVIEPQVQVTEGDLRTLFYRLNTTLRASHIHADTEEQATSIHAKLTQGVPFEDLARQTLKAPALKNHGGDLGYFTVDDMDISFENRAYQMKIGEYSEPVKTSTGYSIILLTDRIETPVLTEQQFIEKKQDLAVLAFRQKRELAIREHIKQNTESFVLNDSVIEEVWEFIQEDPASYTTDGYNEEAFLSTIPTSFIEEVLGSHSSFDFRVADFVQEARYTTQKQRRRAGTLAAFREQLLGMMYRRHVLEMAFRNAEVDRDYVESSSDETFYNALIERFNQSIREKVNVDEQQIREVYASDGEYFAPELYINVAEIPFASMAAAEKGRALIDAGVPFEEVLRRFTLDAGLIDRGGELGLLALSEFGSLAPHLADIRPGEVVGPLDISSHYVVLFQCIERKEAEPLRYETAREAIAEYIEEMEFQRLKREAIREAKIAFDAQIYEDRIAALTLHQTL